MALSEGYDVLTNIRISTSVNTKTIKSASVFCVLDLTSLNMSHSMLCTAILSIINVEPVLLLMILVL